MFLTTEPFFFGCCYDFAIDNQRRCTVETLNHAFLTWSEVWIISRELD